MKRKGIILAGGSGTRLYPATFAFSKQLLPVFDKPMIYYPLSTIMLSDIREVLVISTPQDMPLFRKLLGNGNKWGIKIKYAIQTSPDGIAKALIIAEKFLNGAPSLLILGDNIFYGNMLREKLAIANNKEKGATIFTYFVKDPERYGVAEFNNSGQVLSIEEKPISPKSSYAITGLYFFDENAPRYAKQLKPSCRGELEITDLSKIYLENSQLSTVMLGRGFTWLDTGTHDSLIEAHQFVHTIEKRQGLKIACLEEIAYKKGWINETALRLLAKPLIKNSYGKYLIRIIKEKFNESY